jgi:hypothetical protein
MEKLKNKKRRTVLINLDFFAEVPEHVVNPDDIKIKDKQIAELVKNLVESGFEINFYSEGLDNLQVEWVLNDSVINSIMHGAKCFGPKLRHVEDASSSSMHKSYPNNRRAKDLASALKVILHGDFSIEGFSDGEALNSSDGKPVYNSSSSDVLEPSVFYITQRSSAPFWKKFKSCCSSWMLKKEDGEVAYLYSNTSSELVEFLESYAVRDEKEVASEPKPAPVVQVTLREPTPPPTPTTTSSEILLPSAVPDNNNVR